VKKSHKVLLVLAAFVVLGIIAVAIWPEETVHGLTAALSWLGQFAVRTIEFLSYPGIVILMTFESMIIPMPSELVMPFAGFLAAEAKLNMWLVILFSSLGTITGSLISYYIGYYGGKPFVLKFGKYLLLEVDDLEKTEKWFREKGVKTIFISRFIPVVRHLISIPAGLGRMDVKKFILYTILGGTLWNAFLAWFGYILGKNWEEIRNYSEYVSITVAVLLVAAGIYFLYHRIKKLDN
jgi:membrane protein DedA with SNARE-associated domain